MMVILDDVPKADLWKLLDDLDGTVPTQRLLAAVAYKQGESTAHLADRHNVSQQTIRNWLDRFENRPLEEAPFDEQRTGRPRKLTDHEHQDLLAVLQQSPQAVGHDHQTWEPRLVYHHLKSEYDVEYSLRHIRRFIHEAELSWRTTRPDHSEANPEQAATFQETDKTTDSN
jgi:transposase